MTEQTTLLEQTVASIVPASEAAAQACQRRWDGIGKPLHSLGWLESATARIAGAQHSDRIDITKKILVPFCADNGIVAEGVTQTGQEVTGIVAENFLQEKSCAAIMCRMTGTKIRPIDVGMVQDTPNVEKRKALYGTRNFAKEPAMTRQEAAWAIETGIGLARELKEAGYRLLAAGEMGIGNTTTSSAVASALLHTEAEEMTGRGAGLSNAGLARKIQVIREAIVRYQLYDADVLTVLSCVGGLDIAAMAGFYLGSAACRLPVVLDGFISCVAALVAMRLQPDVEGYLIASHVSKEPAAVRVLEACGVRPVLYGDLCLGEGSGAVAVFPLLDMAAEIYHSMSTFDEIGVETYQEFPKDE